MRISNIPASVRALAVDEGSDTVVNALCKGGLVIGHSSIEFPDEMLDSLTWVVGWKHEIIAGEDRAWLTPTEINEMRALARLLARLNKMGGVEILDPKYDR